MEGSQARESVQLESVPAKIFHELIEIPKRRSVVKHAVWKFEFEKQSPLEVILDHSQVSGKKVVSLKSGNDDAVVIRTDMLGTFFQWQHRFDLEGHKVEVEWDDESIYNLVIDDFPYAGFTDCDKGFIARGERRPPEPPSWLDTTASGIKQSLGDLSNLFKSADSDDSDDEDGHSKSQATQTPIRMEDLDKQLAYQSPSQPKAVAALAPVQQQTVGAGAACSCFGMCGGVAGAHEQERALHGGEWERGGGEEEAGTSLVTEADMKALCHKVHDLTCEKGRWKVVKTGKKGVVVSLASGAPYKFKMILAQVFVRGVTSKAAIEKLADVKYYPRYLALVEEHVESGSLQYVRSVPVWPTDARDFVVQRTAPTLLASGGAAADGSGRQLETWGVASKSVRDKQFPPHMKKSTIRGRIMLAGSTAVDEVREGVPGCCVSVYQHINLRGDLPNFLVNKFSADTPLKMMAAIRKFLEEEPDVPGFVPEAEAAP